VQRIKASNLNRGLVGAWCPSVAGNGLLLPDLSGRGNHGTLTNMDASDWVGTDKGRALDFDGVDDEIVLRSGYTVTNAFAVLCWIDKRVQGSVDNGGIFRNNNTGFWISEVTGRLWGRHAGNNISDAFSGPSIIGAGSCCVGLQFDGSQANLLFNGTVHTSVSSSASTFVVSGFGKQISEYGLYKASEFRIYNRALSASEIKQLYEGGPGYGLRVERKRSRFQVQGFNAGRYRRQQLIGTGVY